MGAYSTGSGRHILQEVANNNINFIKKFLVKVTRKCYKKHMQQFVQSISILSMSTIALYNTALDGKGQEALNLL